MRYPHTKTARIAAAKAKRTKRIERANAKAKMEFTIWYMEMRDKHMDDVVLACNRSYRDNKARIEARTADQRAEEYAPNPPDTAQWVLRIITVASIAAVALIITGLVASLFR